MANGEVSLVEQWRCAAHGARVTYNQTGVSGRGQILLRKTACLITPERLDVGRTIKLPGVMREERTAFRVVEEVPAWSWFVVDYKDGTARPETPRETAVRTGEGVVSVSSS